MGACCSTGHERLDGFIPEEGHRERAIRAEKKDDRVLNNADHSGPRVRFEGSSRFISMFSQQGRKGINQDAMTVWENFNGQKDAYFCAVFDGHGPLGHKVAQQVRDVLPVKLCSSFKQSGVNGPSCKSSTEAGDKNNCNGDQNVNTEDIRKYPSYSSLEASLIKSFEEVDEDLSADAKIDTYCSGTTAVAVLKQGDNLVIANLGDSRAVLCTRGEKENLVPVQLTVDLKPNLPNEAERIKNSEGRVFAMEEEPEVFRIWMPEENCPGLAMARAFGDFCLKDYGLISTPQVFHRKITDNDEFVVLATDGIWDVLSNNEVIKIVASAKKRSLAARLLVHYAVRAWRHKYPTSKVDDCAAVCLFLKSRPLLTKSASEASASGSFGRNNYSDFSVPPPHPKNVKTDDGLDTVINCQVSARPQDNSSTKLSRSVSHGLRRRKPAH